MQKNGKEINLRFYEFKLDRSWEDNLNMKLLSGNCVLCDQSWAHHRHHQVFIFSLCIIMIIIQDVCKQVLQPLTLIRQLALSGMNLNPIAKETQELLKNFDFSQIFK